MKQTLKISFRAFVFAVLLGFCGNVSSQTKALFFTWKVETNTTKDFDFIVSENGSYSINWGDGHITDSIIGNGISQSCSHTYSSTGNFTVNVYKNNTNTVIQTLDISNNNVISLDLSGVTELTNLKCENNSLTTLDLRGLSSLANLYCSNNQLTSLNLRGLSSLMFLRCENNQLTSLDFTGVTKLDYIYCSNNQLTSLNLSYSKQLYALDCSNNSIPSMNLNGLTTLSILDCYNNSLDSINLSGLSSLSRLDCSYNNLTSLNLDSLTKLTNLDFSTNSISSIDLSNLSSLKQLYCYNNSLSSLDLSNLNSLVTLDCHNNSIFSLDLSNLNLLMTLDCSNNSLSSLDLAGLSLLSTLDCHNNSLFSLDLTGLESLSSLYCYNNSITLSNLYAASERILLQNAKYLGTQNLPTQVVNVNEVIDLSSEPVFEGIATNFEITRDGVSVSDYELADGFISIFTPGNYKLRMTNSAVISDSSTPAEVIVNFVVNGTSAVENVNGENLSVYPNPTSGIVNIQGTNEEPTVKVYNMNGGLMQSVVSSTIDLSSYSKGIYLLEVNGTIQKIVKE